MAKTADWWTNERLAKGEIALAVISRPMQVESVRRIPLLGAVSSGMANMILHPNDFGRFLRQHEAVTLICYDAAALQWLLEGHFRQANDAQSLRILWAFSAESRLIDIMLLDQHVRRCQGLDNTVASPLNQLLRLRAGVELPDDHDIQRRVAAATQTSDVSVLELVSAMTAGTLRTYEQLAAEATNIATAVKLANPPPVVTPGLAKADEEEMQSHFDKLIKNIVVGRPNATIGAAQPENAGWDGDEESSLAKTHQYGPLGVGIDVQGAIAATVVGRNGICLSSESLERIAQAAEIQYRKASQVLIHDEHARHVFVGSKGLVRRRGDGLPEADPRLLQKWLRHTFDQLRDIHNARWLEPFDENGNLSIVPADWGVLLRCSPTLHAWDTLQAAAKVICWTRSANTGPVHPNYQVFPELRSSDPDLAYLSSLGGEFVPRSGFKFVAAELDHLELRCFAVNCERRYHQPDVYLAWMFRDGLDPTEQTAARLYEYEAAEQEISSKMPFEDLKEQRVEEFSRWIKTARVLLFGIPRCLGVSQLREMMRQEVDPDLGEADAQQLFDCFVHNTYREFEIFLEDTTLEALAPQLGPPEVELFRRLLREKAPDTTGAAVRNVLEGKGADQHGNQHLWGALRAVVQEERARRITDKAQGGPEAYGLLLQWPITLAGQVGRPAYCTHRRGAEHVVLADGLRKQIAYTLAANSYPLAALANDEILLEIPEDQEVDLSNLESLVISTAEEALGSVAYDCCACRVVDRW
jgi:O6-methylguanine-DNA--protein-cysteine methyltransferase